MESNIQQVESWQKLLRFITNPDNRRRRKQDIANLMRIIDRSMQKIYTLTPRELTTKFRRICAQREKVKRALMNGAGWFFMEQSDADEQFFQELVCSIDRTEIAEPNPFPPPYID